MKNFTERLILILVTLAMGGLVYCAGLQIGNKMELSDKCNERVGSFDQCANLPNMCERWFCLADIQCEKRGRISVEFDCVADKGNVYFKCVEP